jgi:hypothetical protein
MHLLYYWLVLYKKAGKLDRTGGTDVTMVGGREFFSLKYEGARVFSLELDS